MENHKKFKLILEENKLSQLDNELAQKLMFNSNGALKKKNRLNFSLFIWIFVINHHKDFSFSRKNFFRLFDGVPTSEKGILPHIYRLLLH